MKSSAEELSKRLNILIDLANTASNGALATAIDTLDYEQTRDILKRYTSSTEAQRALDQLFGTEI